MTTRTKSSINGRPVSLPGVHKVQAKGRCYWYAWRGGPSLPSPEVDPRAHVSAYLRLTKDAAKPGAPTITSLVCDYQKSPEWEALSDESRRVRGFRLNAIVKEFGTLPLAGVAGKGVRKRIMDWRDTMRDRPCAADDHVEVLSIVFNWAVNREMLETNPAKGINKIYRANRSDVIFTDDDLAALLAAATPSLRLLILAARWTGLRLGDLCDLKWEHVDRSDGIIEKPTNKSRRSPVTTFIVILPQMRAVLAEAAGGACEPRGYVFLRRGEKWRADLASDAFEYLKNKVGIAKHFHDLRGNAATALVAAGMEPGAVDEWMGWKPSKGAGMRRKYVNRRAVAQAMAARIQ